MLLNGVDVIRPIMWKSSDLNVIQIDNNGQFSIVGEVDDTAIVSVWVDGNESAKVAIPVKVVDTTDDKLAISYIFVCNH